MIPVGLREFKQIIPVNETVKVGLEEAVLNDAVVLEFGFGEFFSIFCGNLARIIENGTVIAFQEFVNAGGPVFHRHRDVALGPLFGEIQECADDSAHRLQLIFFEVVLGNGDIGFEYLSAWGFGPGGKAHMLFICVCAFDDEFSGRVAVDCVVHLVLDFLEEDAGGRSIGVIVDGRGVDVRNLLIEAALAEADFPDFLQEMLEVIDIQEAAILHPLFVNDVAAYGELAEYICTPLTELGGSH